MISVHAKLLGIALSSLIAGCGLVKVNDSTVGGNSPGSSGNSNASSGQPGASSSGASAPSGSARSGSAHDSLSDLDVKIGMPIEGRPGFTCDKEKRTASGERQDRHCVKFTDERCKG